nr:MAG TPA: hypothetical protein [Caudoviricetes sp.]
MIPYNYRYEHLLFRQLQYYHNAQRFPYLLIRFQYYL